MRGVPVEPSLWKRRLRDLRALSGYRPRQVAHRLLLLARRRWTSAAPGRARRLVETLRRTPPECGAIGADPALVEFLLDPRVTPPERGQDLLEGRFTFVGLTREFGPRPAWNDRRSAPSHLWRMNLHYHRFLVDAVAESIRRGPAGDVLLDRAAELLDDWNRACLPGDPPAWADAWNSYSVSARLLHAWCARRALESRPGRAADELRRRLDGLGASSAAFLSGWLERDLGGNHLLRNAFALLSAGRWFRGPRAERWLHLGRSLAVEQLDAQILADGFHEERSPMYHAIQLEDLLLASLRVGDGDGEERLRTHASRMLGALEAVLHADGEIARLNDSAHGVAAPASALRALAEGSGVAAARPDGGELSAAGYLRFASPGSILLFDAGALGPDHLPAHAHCDALSLDWSVFGRPVITDTGVDRYEAGPERDFQRSVAAHSTLQAAGLDQGEPFSSFRMGRRPRVAGRREGPDVVEGSHDGFQPLGTHRRRVTCRGASLRWTDFLEGTADCPVAVRLGFAPDVRVALGPGGGRVELPGGHRLRIEWPADGAVSVETGVQCDRFGSSSPRPVVVWRGVGGRGRRHDFAIEPSS